MKRESFGRKAAFAALALLLIWGCRKITSSPAGDPALEGKVSISEEATVGVELSVDTTQLEGTGTITYQWESVETADGDFAPIEGAAGAAYTPLDADEGKYIRVTVTREGYSGSVSSNSAPVKAAPEPEPEPEPEPPLPPEPEPQPEPEPPALTGSVSIPANAKVGEELSVDTTQLEGSGTITYQWQIRDGTYRDIEGAAGAAYTPAPDDAGKYIRVIVKREGYTGSATSDPAGPVALPGISGSVSITGAAKVGVELTADTTQLGVDGEVSYLWQSKSPDGDYEDIEGAAGAAYTPAPDDAGKYIKVTVTLAGYTGSAEIETAEPVKPNVRSVTVSGFTGLTPGMTVAYSAAVEVIPDRDEYKGVTWSIVETSKHDETKIDGNGKLTIAEDETLIQITVIAASVHDESVVSEPLTVSIAPLPAFTQEPDRVFNNTNPIYAIAYGKGKWVAGGYNHTMAYSSDGKSWTKASGSFGNASSSSILAIAYGGGKFVAAYSDIGGDLKAAWSEDGETWNTDVYTGLSVNGLLIGSSGMGITYGHGKFVMVTPYSKGSNDVHIAYSTDGTDWQQVSVDGNDPFVITNVAKIAFGETAGNGKFVAVNKSGKAAYSDDGGETWIASGDTGLSDTSAIAWGGGRFLAVNKSGKSAWSEDGLSWTVSGNTGFTSGSSAVNIVFGNGRFIAAGSAGQLAWSTNGEKWTLTVYGTGDIYGIAFGGEGGKAKFVASAGGSAFTFP